MIGGVNAALGSVASVVNMASYLGGAPWSALYLRIARDWVCLGSLGWGALRSVIWADGLCEHYDDFIERALAL
jgi:hypothetical protein